MKYRKAQALFHYVIVISIVALAVVTMHTYLRRTIQAKVKDLTDHIISEKQLASLSDPDTETSTRDINSTYSLERVESIGGASSLNIASTYTAQTEHEVESSLKVDYGQTAAQIEDSLSVYVGYPGEDPGP